VISIPAGSRLWLDSETGEIGEQKLFHASGNAQRFYEQLAVPALIGVEVTGNSMRHRQIKHG